MLQPFGERFQRELSITLHNPNMLQSSPTYEYFTRGAGRAHTTQAVEKSGFNACFSNELPVHCLAAEPRETLLRVGVWDHGTLVAYDTLVLGTLRAGHRCIQLRSRLGTRIELCHLFVHVALGEEVNMGASSVELREELGEGQRAARGRGGVAALHVRRELRGEGTSAGVE